MHTTITLFFIVSIACISCYSISETFLRRVGSKSQVCPDGNCSCDDGETCCQKKNQSVSYCCPEKGASCCKDSDDCCPADMPVCSTCGQNGVITCCAATDTKCCGAMCCHADSFPGCVFGYCVLGKRNSATRSPSIKMTKILQPDSGSSGKCIVASSTTSSPGKTTTASSKK